MSRRVCVAVVTRGGTDSLPALLASLGRQVIAPTDQLELLVLDNSANAVEVDRLGSGTPDLGAPLRILHEPRAGIPFARNAVVRDAVDRGIDVVAWMDDDEFPGDDLWLARHLDCMTSHGAVVSHGPRSWSLPPDTSAWVRDCSEFDSIDRETGSQQEIVSSANCVTAIEIFLATTPWFDEDRVAQGGTDSEFFTRVARNGQRMVWCAEAVVRAPVAPDRATLAWVLRRRLRTGGTKGWVQRSIDGLWSIANARRIAAGFVWILTGALRAVIGLPVGLLGSRWGRRASIDGLRRVAFGVGTVLASSTGWTYGEYAARR